MNAYQIPNLRFSLPAGGAVARRRFVNVNSNGEGVIATAAGAAIGTSMNQAATGEVLEIADGITIVEAQAAIAAGADVQVGTLGRAVTKTSGIGVGVALTSAGAEGNFIAVKLMSVSAANGADGEDAATLQTILYTSSDLAAGADLTDAPLGLAIGAGTIESINIISLGSAVGVDDANTSVFLLEVGTDAKGTLTFDATNAFPAAGVAAEVTVADADVAAGDVLLLTVTNGATADLPVFMVQVVIALA